MSAPDNGARVRVTDLEVRFSGRVDPALSGVTLSIDPGERVALLGSSGSGKTTLLRSLVGAVPVTAGHVDIDGDSPQDSTAVEAVRRRTGVLRQGADLVPSLSAQLNAVMGCAPGFTIRDWLGLPLSRVPVAQRGRLAELAARHGVTDLLAYRVADLSGGQRQRVAFVRAVLGAPSLLLADEPTTGLDPVAVGRVVDDLMSTEASTVIVTTHDLEVARRFPRIIGLRGGRVVHDGPDITAAHAQALYAEASRR